MSDVRRMLREKADQMPVNLELPSGLRKRARHRRLGTVLLTGTLAVAGGFGSYTGIRTALDDDPVGFGRQVVPAEQPAAPTSVWPNASLLQGMQEQVDDDIFPQRVDPERVAETFARDVLGWTARETEIESSIGSSNPVVNIFNRTIQGSFRTVLHMSRFENRPDGVLFVTLVSSENIHIDHLAPGDEVPPQGPFLVKGRLPLVPEDGHLIIEIRSANEIAEAESTPRQRFRHIFELNAVYGPTIASVKLLDARGQILGYTAFPLAAETEEEGPTKGEHGVEVEVGSSTFEFEEIGPFPKAVEDARREIRLAATERDWDALERLIPDRGFTFSLGGGRDAITFWQQLEGEGTPVLEILATLTSFEGERYQGLYTWPAAATRDPKDWNDTDFEQLAQIYSEPEIEQLRNSDSYYGWRVGIEPDGDWIFFVAGD